MQLSRKAALVAARKICSKSVARRLGHGLQVAVHTLATAPQESWQSVAVTAGAAASLILDPVGMQDTWDEGGDGEDEAGAHTQGGPVGRAKVRWKEAQNEMPEVRTCLAWSCFEVFAGSPF